jgi:DNA-binding NtrC family response regulator
MKKKLLLIVEDDPEMRDVLFGSLSQNGHTIFTADSAEAALRLIDQRPFDLVLTDVRLPDQNGLQLLDTLKSRSPHLPVIMMTGFGTIQNAVEAMKKGAFDYLLKPFSLESLSQRVQNALDESLTHPDVRPDAVDFSEIAAPIMTQDRRMKELLSLCHRIAPSKAIVLIQGESGTGKELFARYIHSLSPRSKGPFVAVNCASLPETLFESELFGHEKGAFTGALCRKMGKFELAHGGTLLLDEISEMSTLLQAKILRVLQENEVDRIGGREPVAVDTRVIATTNRNLEASIKKGEFREDLYYRLNVVSMTLPPLRDRVEDIDLLTDYFLQKYAGYYQKIGSTLSEPARLWLRRQPWRGNVRELKNVMERAVLISPEPVLDLKDFCMEQAAQAAAGHSSGEPSSLSLREMEKSLIHKALEKTNGNRTYAAKILGISIRTLRNKLNEYKQSFALQEAE